jgi:transposase-like protein
MLGERPALFRGRHFADEIIVLCVRWYLRFSLSYRDLEELMAERNLTVDHTTVWRWVQRYAPELNRRVRRELKPMGTSWRADETYIRVAGRWMYLYRAIDSAGATIDFYLSRTRDLAAATAFFRKCLHGAHHPRPRVINVDGHASYRGAAKQLKRERKLGRRCRCRTCPYLNNIIEQDHRAVKRRIIHKQGFRSFGGAQRTIAGYETIHIIRKGQVRWLAKGDVAGQVLFISQLFGLRDA